jgi:hypothetical protein
VPERVDGRRRGRAVGGGLPQLRAAVSEIIFETWIAPLHAHRIDADGLVLGSPAGQTGRVRDRFAEILQSAIGDFSVVTCGGHA